MGNKSSAVDDDLAMEMSKMEIMVMNHDAIIIIVVVLMIEEF